MQKKKGIVNFIFWGDLVGFYFEPKKTIIPIKIIMGVVPLIKLGGMNYDSLEPILDLHQDIELDDHDEYEKDRAGIPSIFTNVT